MNPATIQRDYGGFDSRFLGLTIRFDEQYHWELYTKCNTRNRDPNEVVKIGNEALQQGRDKAFQIFSIATTLVHEARHFHDSLLSPYGNHLFRIRIYAAINGLQAIGLYKKGRKILPVPFSMWKKKTPSELTSLADYWKEVYNVNENPLPASLTGDELNLTTQTETAYEIMRNLVRNPETERLQYSFQPAHVFEASGILTQIQNVYSVFGAEHANLFMEVIFNSPDALCYTLPLRLLNKLFNDQERPFDTAIASMIVFWCIMGDYIKDKYNACPTVRFARLLDYLSKTGLPSPNTMVQDAYQQWTEDLKATPIDQALQNESAANERLLATLDGMPANHRELFSDIIDTFRSRVNSVALMKRLFLADNDSYVRPYQYTENTGSWVAAPIRVDFADVKLVSTEENLLRVLDIRSGTKMDGGEIAVSRAVMKGQTEGVELIDSVKAASTNDIMTLVDFHFSDFCRDDPDFDIVRRALRNENIHAYELFDCPV